MASRILPLLMLLTFLISGCQPKVATIPSAENMRMTKDGRLFVTGSQGIYEIKKGNDKYTTNKLNTDNCQYKGLAEMNDWLYTLCIESYGGLDSTAPFYKFASTSIWAYPLKEDPSTAKLRRLSPVVSAYFLPNGMDALPEKNQLIVADDNPLFDYAISLVDIRFESNEPVGVRITGSQAQWINEAQGVTRAKGVRVIDNSVFFTAKGELRRVDLDENGEPITTATLLYKDKSIFYDLAPYCDGVVIADFLKGQLVYVNKEGTKAQVIQKGLFTPSAVVMNAAPMFDDDVYLVSELGRPSEGEGGTAKGKVMEYSKSEKGLSCDKIGIDVEPPVEG